MVFRTLGLLLAVVVVSARPAAAITVRDVIELSKAGLSDDVLVALIETDRTVFTLTPEQLVELKEAGVSDRVVLVMVRQGRERPEAAPAAPPAAPDIIVIGDKPSPPPPPPPVIVVPPVVVTIPVFLPFFTGLQGGCVTPGLGTAEPPFGRFINSGGIPDPRPIRAWGPICR